MPKLDVYNVAGDVVGSMELEENIFAIKENEHAVYEVVKNHLANRRQGTQSARTRSEVRGGGRKPYRQKGTGRARQGTISAPHFVGGGAAFAPKPRSYRYTLPKKVKRLALKSVLSAKVRADEIIIVDQLTVEQPKTKEMVKVLSNLKADKKTLIVTCEKDDIVVRTARNLPGVKTAFIGILNVYDLINHNSLVITKDAVEKLQEVYA